MQWNYNDDTHETVSLCDATNGTIKKYNRPDPNSLNTLYEYFIVYFGRFLPLLYCSQIRWQKETGCEWERQIQWDHKLTTGGIRTQVPMDP